ncbi:MAG TPA: 3-oxoacyl-ACP synthase, partial [Methylomirabilota bacterium]|nr:3-oxoacyl-ACP synthase [Methylomirabilota bacterium]
SSTKGLYGHALGASGAIEAVITAMALQRSVLPGTCNLCVADPEIELNLLRATTPTETGAALTNSSGFGGMNAALVIGRHEPAG